MDQIKKDELSKLENEFDNLNADILQNERQLERDRITGEEINNSKPKQEINDADNKIIDAFAKFLHDPTAENRAIYNALQQDNPTQAGYLVTPQKFVMELIQEMDNTMIMRRLGTVLPTLKGAQSLGYPKMTTDMSVAVWGTEIAAPTADTALAFGKKELKPNPATAEILVSKTLLRNASNVDSIVRSRLIYKFAELMEQAYMTGDGANKPLGIFVASNDGISTTRDVSTGNTQTEIKIDGLLEAKYSIKDQYQGRCQWLFNRVNVKKLAKLKDSDGQYVWQPSVVMGTPDMLLGRPLNSSEYVPSTNTTGLYVGMYADFSYYWIVDSFNLEIQALLELAARTNQVDYIARIETDGMPVLEEAFARIKLA
jgi:HK97 family phage major capsid protein